MTALPWPGRTASTPDGGPRHALLWWLHREPQPPPVMSRLARSLPGPAGFVATTATGDEARLQRDRQLASSLLAAARGDQRAFEAFYETSFACAHGVARRLLGTDRADDLLADVYFEAWREVASYDPARGSAMTWLLTRVRSRALDVLRRREPVQTAPRTLDGTADGNADGTADAVAHAKADDSAGPLERLWQRQSSERLHDALSTLGSRERWLLGLAYFRELSHAQIAGCTGLPLGSVKTTLQRAQQRLRAVLTAPPAAPAGRHH